MTIHALVPYNESLTLPLPQLERRAASPSKSLNASNPELASWYEQASTYYSAVVNGSEVQPDPAAWQEFLNQMRWASEQLGAAGWDPIAGANPASGNPDISTDPFGGAAGPMGNIVHSEMDCRLGFVADGQTHDVFAYNFTLDVASPGAVVTVEMTTDTRTQPPEENVARIVVKDPATGTETVYLVHAVSELENFNINTPKGKKVTDSTGQVTVGEFVEGATGASGGIPDSAEIEGDTASYDGIAGTVLEFSPPFGGIGSHQVNADMRLQVNNSDQLLVTREDDGGYRITVTDADGKVTRFNVPSGFKIELLAHAENVRFQDGGGIGETLAIAGTGTPSRTTAGSDGASGVPPGWENITLNGEASAASNPTEELPPRLLDLLDLMGIDPNDPNFSISESLLGEIEAGITPPSDDLLETLKNNDAVLQAAWRNYRDHPDDAHAMKQVRDRLATLLGALFDDVGKSGDFPEGVEPDPLLEARALFFGDTAFELNDDFQVERIVATHGVDAQPGAEGREQDALANAEMLANLPAVQWSADEILAWADSNKLDLSYIGYPPSGGIWQLLFEIDRDFESKLKNWIADPSYETIKPLRNHIIEMFQAIYPGMEISDNGSGDQRRNDIKVDGSGVNIFPDSWISHQPEVEYSEDELWRYLADHFDTND